MSSIPSPDCIEDLIRTGPFNCVIERSSEEPDVLIFDLSNNKELICHKHQKALTATNNWTSGRNKAATPRIINGISKNCILVSRVYQCSNGCGDFLGHEEFIINQLTFEVPFVLFHRSGILKNLLTLIVNCLASGTIYLVIVMFLLKTIVVTILNFRNKLFSSTSAVGSNEKDED